MKRRDEMAHEDVTRTVRLLGRSIEAPAASGAWVELLPTLDVPRRAQAPSPRRTRRERRS